MTAPPVVPGRYARAAGGQVVCELCPHECRLDDGQRGVCGVRRNAGGVLVTDAWGLAAAARPASLERSLLFHLLPGARAFAFGAPGCNLRCGFCQNWMVSQMPKGPDARLEGRVLPPEPLVAEALALDCAAVVCTYTEATIFFEYALDVAVAARAAGLRVAWKTNGYINPAPLAEAAPLLDAVNVDLKGLRDDVHRRVTGARLAPVLDAALAYRAAGVWVEVTTPVIPTINDDPAELADLAAFVRDALGPDTPWHLTRFHADHELRHLPPTPKPALQEARERALSAGLRYVYTDADARGVGWSTLCPGCGAAAVERAEYALVATSLRAGACARCGTALAGVWQ